MRFVLRRAGARNLVLQFRVDRLKILHDQILFTESFFKRTYATLSVAFLSGDRIVVAKESAVALVFTGPCVIEVVDAFF